MGFGGRRAFQRETRTTRNERLHGFKAARTGFGEHLSPEEHEKRRAEAFMERERYRRERFAKHRSAGSDVSGK